MVLGVAALVLLVAAGSAALCTRVAEVAMTGQFTHTMRSLTENLARNAAHGVFIESEPSSSTKPGPPGLKTIFPSGSKPTHSAPFP